MRPPRRDPLRDPRPNHGVPRTVLGAVAATVLIPGLVIAVLYPVAAVSVVVSGIGAALAIGALVRRYRVRRRRGRTREVCVPKTGVCVEV
ncbi:hypothetical protein [Halorussus marinus]|uniref:hypothetical protein n=1 Tax=Halorussus marinus TaxID=2505976 RepID=UPI00106E3516|nr:hypothetical protein [Halorussus marinus]